MILLIDNYDSFVYNLARYFRELGCETEVVRNDAISVADVRRLQPAAIVLSPGPCTPDEAGISIELVRSLWREVPMLGVCLGFQAIAAAFGAAIVRAPTPVHGQISHIQHSGERLFANLQNPLQATRYHSLVVDEKTLPSELKITARTVEGLPMALEHPTLPLFGTQFHPESVLSQSGHQLLSSFLFLSGIESSAIPPGDVIPSTITDEWKTSSGEPLHW